MADGGQALRGHVGDARYAASLIGLPPSVALFLLRARRHALRSGDVFSRDSAIRPRELRALLDLARGRRLVVELGTGTGWSAIALALGDRARKVRTYDPCVRPEREAYLDLAYPSVRARVELRNEADHHGPVSDERVDFLFVDSAHDCESVVGAFRAWRDALASGAVVAFHDYGHPSYPGVREAIELLGLSGRQEGGLYVWSAEGTR